MIDRFMIHLQNIYDKPEQVFESLLKNLLVLCLGLVLGLVGDLDGNSTPIFEKKKTSTIKFILIVIRLERRKRQFSMLCVSIR